MHDQFIVPQFLDVESKIFGPITVRQFLIMIVVALILAISWKIFAVPVFGVIALITGGLGAAFAFFKVNGRRFDLFLVNYIQSIKRPNVRMWGKEYSDDELHIFRKQVTSAVVAQVVKKRRPSESHLAKLSLVVNTGGAYQADDDRGGDAPLNLK